MSSNIDLLKKQLSQGFQKDVDLKLKRPNLYQVYNPFYYPDGDMVELFLKEESSGEVVIEDLGITLMRLSYEFNVDTKNKRRVFQEIMSNYNIEENNGSLQIKTSKNELFSSVMQLINVIIKVSDIGFLKRELVRSLFYEYFGSFVEKKLESFDPIVEFYPEFDKEKQYPTPYAFRSKRNEYLCVYPIASDDKTNETTITVQHYELHDFKPDTLAVFENQESIGRKPLARLSNIIGKQFSTLEGNEERISEHITRQTIK